MTDISPRALETIAHNLCSLHDFEPEFVKAQERFARAVIAEYLAAQPSAGAQGEAVAWLIEWEDEGEPRRRVQFGQRIESWLEQHAPKLTALGPIATPAQPDTGAVEALREALVTIREKAKRRAATYAPMTASADFADLRAIADAALSTANTQGASA